MSGIYIHGMEMPIDGSAFVLVIHPDGVITTVTSGKELPYRAIPVPDHGRLMDKDAVNLQGGPYEYDEWCEWALDQYMNAPIILPADKEGK